MTEPRIAKSPGKYPCRLPGAPISRELEAALLARCKDTGQNMCQVIRQALEQFLQNGARW